MKKNKLVINLSIWLLILLKSGNANSQITVDNSVDLFIISGESNIGVANINDQPIPATSPQFGKYSGPLSNCFTWNWRSNKFVLLEAGKTSNINNLNNPLYGSEISFMYEVQKSLQKPLYLLKYGRGGTTLGKNSVIGRQDWNVESNNELLDSLIFHIKKIQNYYQAVGKTINYKGIIFWIGENDSNDTNYSNAFYNNLLATFQKLRSSIGQPQLPIYLSKLNKYLDNPVSNEIAIEAAMNNFISGDPYSKLFSTDPYVLFDGAHFTGKDYLNIGKNILAPFFRKMWIPSVCNSYLWALKAGGNTTSKDIGNDVTVDNNGNIYVTGTFKGAATFGNITLNSAGESDIFVVKYDANTNVVWAKKYGGPNNDVGVSLDVDESGNLIICGNFTGTSLFESTTLNSNGGNDIFILKLSATGSLIWVSRGGGTGEELITGMAIRNGEIYITGSFLLASRFGNTSMSSSGDKDIFVAKLNGLGNFQWANRYGGIGSDISSAITVDNGGNSYITGSFSNTAFDLISKGGTDIFLLKCNALGSKIWGKSAGGKVDDYSRGIDLDAQGNIFITGSFMGVGYFIPGDSVTNSGGEDLFYAKYNANGICVKVVAKSGGAHDSGKDIVIDKNGEINITGWANSVKTFESGMEASDVYIIKYKSDGTILYQSLIAGPGTEMGKAVTIDNSSNIYVTGVFENTVNFGPISLTSSGKADIFLAKLNCVPIGSQSGSLFRNENTKLLANFDDSLIMSPNPNDGFFSLSFKDQPNYLKYSITNYQGKVICPSFNISELQYINYVNVNHLETGLYLLKVQTDTATYCRRLLIQK